MRDPDFLTQALKAAADATNPLGLDAWIVLLEWSDDQAGWAKAWDQLTDIEREKLLDRLHSDREPLAGALLQVLAENAALLGRAQAKQQLLLDAAERTAELQKQWAERVQYLRDLGREGSAAALDEANRVIELRRIVEELEAELKSVESHDTREWLESQLARLELRRQAAQSYDPAVRQAELDRLNAELSELESRKTEIEGAISRAPKEKGAALQRLGDARRRADVLAAESAQVHEQLRQAEAEVDRRTQDLNARHADLNARHGHLERLIAALNDLPTQIRQAEADIARAELALTAQWRESLLQLHRLAHDQETLLVTDRSRVIAAKDALGQAIQKFTSRQQAPGQRPQDPNQRPQTSGFRSPFSR